MMILLIPFLVCLVALAWRWHNQPAMQREEPGPSPPTPAPIDRSRRLNRVRERNTEHAFLKLLIACDESREGLQLQDSLGQADRDEQCLRRASFLMGLLLLLSLAGLGYCAIFLPESLRNPPYFVIRGLCYLGLGSLISQVAFLGYFFWHHAAVGRLHSKCRGLVLALTKSCLNVPVAAGLSLQVETHAPNGFPQSSTQPIEMPLQETSGQEPLRSSLQ